MRFFGSILLACVIHFSVCAQTENVDRNIKQETGFNFDNSYYLLAKSDNTNNYFVVDFSRFPGRFEKIYFKNLVYKNKIIVSIDSDMDKGVAWFQANKVYDLATVKLNFDEMVEKTLNAGTHLDNIQKEDWLKKNTK